MSTVALVSCSDYSIQQVDNAVMRVLSLLGGADVYAAAGERILLKPNMLAGDPPEKAVTTHPSLMRAVALALKPAGASLFYGDSPIYGSTAKTAQTCGLAAAAAETGIELLDFSDSETTSYDEGTQNRVFELARAVKSCDRIISLSKLKTHGLTGMTGAVKNQFGCISGMNKGKFHVKLPEVERFSTMLVDLNICLKPSLYIMDAVICMEGNGPRGGKPRFMGCILGSTDPVALDSVAACLIGFRPEEIPTCRAGNKAGLGNCDMKQIEIVGDDWQAFVINDFARSQKFMSDIHIGRGRLRNALIAKPVIDEQLCTSCGICVLACPANPKALSRERECRPAYDYDRCIRCYCCQESCPEGAISLITPTLGRFFNRITS